MIFKKSKPSEYSVAISAMRNMRSAQKKIIPTTTAIRSVISPPLVTGLGASNYIKLSVSSTATAVNGDASHTLSEPRSGDHRRTVDKSRQSNRRSHDNDNKRHSSPTKNTVDDSGALSFARDRHYGGNNGTGNGRGVSEYSKDQHGSGGHNRDNSHGDDRGGSSKRHRDDMSERRHSKKKKK